MSDSESSNESSNENNESINKLINETNNLLISEKKEEPKKKKAPTCSNCGNEGHINTKNKPCTLEPKKKIPIEPKETNNNEENNNEEKILEICPIPSSIDLEKLKYEVKKYIESRADFYKETKRNLYVEDEFSEYWLAKVSNGTEIGKGNCKMDVKTSDNEGIDAMCVIMNNNNSNEKSLKQGFTSGGNNLDNLFLTKK